MLTRLVRRLMLVASGVLVGFLLLELVVRILHNGARPMGAYDTTTPVISSRWVAHPFLPYAGRPSSRFELFNGPERTPETIVTNSYGYRAHEFPADKKPGDYFVFAFGGSTTYGYKVASNEETWPELLEHKLQARYPDRHVLVFNLGVDMGTNVVALVHLALVAVHMKPDLVIEYEGYNDLAALGYSNFRTDQAHFYKDIDPAAVSLGFQLNTPQLLKMSYVIYYATGTLDYIFGMNDLMQTARMPQIPDPDRFRGIEATLENLKSMKVLAEGYGAQALFGTFQFTYEHDHPEYERFNNELRRYFDANRFMYVDQAALIADADPSINVDDCHFTPKGNGMMAENFFRYIVDHQLMR